MASEHNHFTPQQRFKCTSDHCRKSLKVQKRSERSVNLPESSDGLAMQLLSVGASLTRILCWTNKTRHPSVGVSS